MNAWSTFIWRRHGNATGGKVGGMLHVGVSSCFHFKQSIEVLKPSTGRCRTRGYTSSQFPSETCGICRYTEAFRVIIDLLSRNFKKKIKCWWSQQFCYKFQEGQDFFASFFCSILISHIPGCGVVFREMLPVTVLFLTPVSWARPDVQQLLLDDFSLSWGGMLNTFLDS